MAYRLLEVRTVVADDQNLNNKVFDREASIYKTVDLETVTGTLRIAPGASEATVSLGSLTTGKFISIYSDYPVIVRLNGASETQFTMSVQNTPVVNTGAPAPSMCYFGATINVTSLRISPVTGATQTATVQFVVTGDPTTDYTV